MKKFIINLFSNRFGIVLATLNVCYLASKVSNLQLKPLDIPFMCANIPAFLLTMVPEQFIRIFASDLSFQSRRLLLMSFAGIFVVLQWLFIAWFAKTIAGKIRPKEL